MRSIARLLRKERAGQRRSSLGMSSIFVLFIPILLLSAIAITVEFVSSQRISTLARIETNGIELSRGIHEVMSIGYVMSQDNEQDAANWQSSFRSKALDLREMNLLLCSGNFPTQFDYELGCSGELGLERSLARFINSADRIGTLDPEDPERIRRYLSHLFVGTNGNLLPTIDVITGRLGEARKNNSALHRKGSLLGGAMLLLFAAGWTYLAVRALRAKLRSAMRASEHARLKAEAANAAKSDFLATMSHEIRTPLNAILGFSQMIEGEYVGPLVEKPLTYKDYATDISNSAQHLLMLIDDILDLAKAESGKMELYEEEFDLQETADQVAAMLRTQMEKKSLQFGLRIAENATVLGDQRLVKQAMINLLSNAAKFTPEKGSVSLWSCVDEHGWLRINVTDTGIGIAPEDLPHIKDKFFQVESVFSRDVGGTGLGLSIVERIAMDHQGKLEMQSAPGKGTTVTVLIPPERFTRHSKVKKVA